MADDKKKDWRPSSPWAVSPEQETVDLYADRPTALQNDLFDQLVEPSEVSGVPTEQILKDVSPNEVLILPCGSAKDPASCAMEAYKRYTGRMWGEARKAMGADAPKFLEKAGLDLYILSAEHGLMDAGKLIENYDRELTPERLEEIKGDKTLRETISNTLAQYDPDKIHLGTPKKYTKLITDVMGRDYKSVFPEGSGSGLQKKGIIDYIKSRAQTSKEMVPYEDLDEPTLPMGDGSKKRGGATKPKSLGWGIGSLARRYQPLLQLIQVAQGMWEDLSPEKKEAVTSLMNTPVEDLIGLDTSGLDYYRDLLGILPPGGIMDVANEVPEDYQLDLVEDTDLKKDYVRNTGIGDLFDFDYGKGAMDTAQRQQDDRTELYRKQQIMKNAEGPRVLEDLESKERGYQMRRSRSGPYRLETPSDPLFEVGKVDLETHMRQPKGLMYRQGRYKEEMGTEPKIGIEGAMPRGWDSPQAEAYWKEQGWVYPSQAPKTNYYIEPRFPSFENVTREKYGFSQDTVTNGPHYLTQKMKFNQELIDQHNLNIENLRNRSEVMRENPTEFSLDITSVEDRADQLEGYIRNAQGKIDALEEKNQVMSQKKTDPEFKAFSERVTPLIKRLEELGAGVKNDIYDLFVFGSMFHNKSPQEIIERPIAQMKETIDLLTAPEWSHLSPRVRDMVKKGKRPSNTPMNEDMWITGKDAFDEQMEAQGGPRSGTWEEYALDPTKKRPE